MDPRKKRDSPNLVEGETFPVFGGEFLHALERSGRWIVEVIDNYGGVTAGKQLKHRVTSDVSSTAGYQNVLRHHRSRDLRKKKTLLCFFFSRNFIVCCEGFKRNGFIGLFGCFVCLWSSEEGFWFLETVKVTWFH